MDASRSKRLIHRHAASPGRVVARRATMVVGLLLAVVTIFWLERDSLRDTIDGTIELSDVVYFTAVTVTTVGYGDIVPVTPRARLIDALVVTPIRFFIWIIFFGTAYELAVQNYFEERRMQKLQRRLKQHVIVLGYGFEGRMAAHEIVARGKIDPSQMVVIDKNQQVLEGAALDGFTGLCGDATDEDVLMDARPETASSAVVCTPRDDTTVLCVLRLRQMNPALRIIASVRREDNVKLVLQAGANEVVTPSKLAGLLMADAVDSRYTTRFIADILSSRGVINMAERRVRPEEVGQRMSDLRGILVVALERDGTIIGFWNHPDAMIVDGDLIFALEGRDQNGERAAKVTQ